MAAPMERVNSAGISVTFSAPLAKPSSLAKKRGLTSLGALNRAPSGPTNGLISQRPTRAPVEPARSSRYRSPGSDFALTSGVAASMNCFSVCICLFLLSRPESQTGQAWSHHRPAPLAGYGLRGASLVVLGEDDEVVVVKLVAIPGVFLVEAGDILP